MALGESGGEACLVASNAGGSQALPQARGGWGGVLLVTRAQGGKASWLWLHRPIKLRVRWPGLGKRARARETRRTDGRTAGQQAWCVGKLHVAGRTSGRVRRLDQGSRARLEERVQRSTTRTARHGRRRARTFTFRPDRFSLGHFDHDLLKIFELKCIEE
jgi:hypothetical protein